LDLWQQLTSSNAGLTSKKGRDNATSSTAGSGNKKVQDPIDDFVSMEYDLAGDICTAVDASLISLKKVSQRGSHIVSL